MKRADIAVDVVRNVGEVQTGIDQPKIEQVHVVKEKVVFYTTERAGEYLLTLIYLDCRPNPALYTTEPLLDFRKRFLRDSPE